jgi:hypothetical protein
MDACLGLCCVQARVLEMDTDDQLDGRQPVTSNVRDAEACYELGSLQDTSACVQLCSVQLQALEVCTLGGSNRMLASGCLLLHNTVQYFPTLWARMACL